MAGFRYEKERIMRMLFPKQRDHSAWLLMNICGRPWLLLTGWKREWRVMGEHGWIVIDLAHPRLKLALEADGEKWHRDIVKEEMRNSALQGKGWSIKHFRYPRLKNEPRKVRREVRRWFWNALILNYRR